MASLYYNHYVMQVTRSISYQTDKKALQAVTQWLLKEQQETGSGFYCNINSIESSYKKKNFVAICVEGVPVGFAIWHFTFERVATIDILETQPEHRRSGLANLLVQHLLTIFKSEGLCAVRVQCSPEESEPFWRRMGFTGFPETKNGYWNHTHPEQYQVLVPHAPYTNHHATDRLEMWNDEPSHTEGKPPNWTWNLIFSEDGQTLKLPIVHPCHSDWRLRWIRGEEVLRDEKVKYFSKEEIDLGGFLLVKELR